MHPRGALEFFFTSVHESLDKFVLKHYSLTRI
jgi:hypothetical protein